MNNRIIKIKQKGLYHIRLESLKGDFVNISMPVVEKDSGINFTVQVEREAIPALIKGLCEMMIMGRPKRPAKKKNLK